MINKEKLDLNDIKLTTLIAGRVIGDTLHLINVYTPNDLAQHTHFWPEVVAQWSANDLPSPHIMTGNFNMVEDPLDQTPARNDSKPTTVAL